MSDVDSSFFRAIIGMIFIIAGAIVASIGAKVQQVRDSCWIRKRQREDLKPFNEAKGGMINDVISNIDVVDRMTRSDGQREIIKIRCRNCDSLNDEDARFCKSCGKRNLKLLILRRRKCMDYLIRDIDLAPEGYARINWVKGYMPLLNQLEREFEEGKAL